MSTPVVTSTWAGNFDCDSCRRKRLMGEEFSKKALEKYRKQGGPLKCKQCVQSAAETEREAAALRRRSNATTFTLATTAVPLPGTDTPPDYRVCAKCQQNLGSDQYNRNQWNNKGVGQSKCRACVEQGLRDEEMQQKQSVAHKLSEAKARVAAAQTVAERVAAESHVAALEAQKVTGLRPIQLGRGGRGGSITRSAEVQAKRHGYFIVKQ